MNKTLFIVGGLLLLTANVLNAQNTVFKCDFESGLPSGFTTYDLDGNEPSRGMKKYGLTTGIGWCAYSDSSSEPANTVAVSGSWYTTEAKSNDWLITSAIHIDDAHSILSWIAKSSDSAHPDGYRIYVSTTGNTPQDFTDDAIFETSGESSTWSAHELSLEAYTGSDIYIAFVNNSTNCNILMLDDINVYTHPHSFSFRNLTPESVSSEGNVEVSCEITPSGYLPIEGYKLELQYNGQTYIVDKSDVVIPSGTTDTATFDYLLPAKLDATIDYTLTISTDNGKDVLSNQYSLTCFNRTVLIEEGTGTWCMWCPRGQYGLQLLHESNPNRFIDVAVHLNDPMSVDDYAAFLYPFFIDGVPNCVMNRSYDHCGDPYYNVEELLHSAMDMGAIGKISIDADIDENDIITVTSTSELGKDIVDDRFGLSFIIVEDKVTGYAQSNGYSGGNTPMGGLENMDDPITDYTFANVARSVFPSLDGDNEAFPIGTHRHTPIITTYTTTLPETIQDKNNVKIIGLILDKHSGEIVNATETPLNNSSKIDNITSDNGIIINSMIGGFNISAHTPLLEVEVFDIAGRLLQHVKPNSCEIVISKSDHSSPSIIKVRTIDQTHVAKCY